MATEITSRTNEKIKRAVKLSQSAKYRREEGEFFLQGLRLCFDAYLTGLKPRQLFYTSEAMAKHPDEISAMEKAAGESCLITEEVAEKLSDTDNNQGIFALYGKTEKRAEFDYKGKYVFLEEIQNPQNLGAVIRTAEALGVSGAVLCRCCDIYNPKALRAAMGSTLRLPVFETENAPEFLLDRKQKGMKILAAVPDSSAADISETDFGGGCIAVIGNEGNGVSDEVKSLCLPVTIPMPGGAESLNAFAAATITIWEMTKGRRN